MKTRTNPVRYPWNVSQFDIWIRFHWVFTSYAWSLQNQNKLVCYQAAVHCKFASSWPHWSLMTRPPTMWNVWVLWKPSVTAGLRNPRQNNYIYHMNCNHMSYETVLFWPFFAEVGHYNRMTRSGTQAQLGEIPVNQMVRTEYDSSLVLGSQACDWLVWYGL